jgi:hypothetical protein
MYRVMSLIEVVGEIERCLSIRTLVVLMVVVRHGEGLAKGVARTPSSGTVAWVVHTKCLAKREQVMDVEFVMNGKMQSKQKPNSGKRRRDELQIGDMKSFSLAIQGKA